MSYLGSEGSPSTSRASSIPPLSWRLPRFLPREDPLTNREQKRFHFNCAYKTIYNVTGILKKVNQGKLLLVQINENKDIHLDIWHSKVK